MNQFNQMFKKKRIRKNYSKIPFVLPIPNLLIAQNNGYKKFFINDDNDQNNINNIFRSLFPIKNNNIKIDFISYKLGHSIYDIYECLKRGLSYTGSLKVLFSLKFKKNIYKEQEVYLGEIPLMTPTATFIINGTERVIVSQLHRSPGVVYNIDKSKYSLSNKILYNAKIIPAIGAWITFEFDIKDLLYVKIGRKKKLLVTILLKALKFTTEQILYNFFVFDKLFFNDNKIFLELIPKRLKGQISDFNIVKNNITYISKGTIITNKDILELEKNNITHIEVDKEYLINKIVAKNYLDNITGEIICLANTKLNIEIINKLMISNIKIIEILFINNLSNGDYISKTLSVDKITDYKNSLEILYKYLKPGEPFNKVKSVLYIHNLFFSEKKFNLTIVGRKKLNQSLEKKVPCNKLSLTRLDIIQVLKKLINIKNGIYNVDEIDHLGNRRIKSLAEMLSYHLRLALFKMKKIIKERLNEFNIKKDLKKYKLQDLFNSKIITMSIKEFFTSSQLSQFMDQTNPLAEITHKRRISAFGPGGLNRDHAGFEIRDIHSSHYGRLCPIETPEGPNIGLITSLALYAKINKYGFLVTPYLKVIDGKISNIIDYISADEEKIYYIAQANSYKNGILDEKKLHICRFNYETVLVYSNQINYIDISTLQLLSVGTALIPFVEHDDANRALMGTNMQRQAVPLLRVEKPLIGTGIEEIVAKDSGITIYAKRGGFIFYLDSRKIIIKVNNNEIDNNNNKDIGYDIYYLLKYYRTNQNTCINQRPCINLNEEVKAGDLIIDSNSTDLGELAIGQNVRIAFMSWHGYNYEDSIIISDQLIKEDKFTNIHIEELTCLVRDTKLGQEKITKNIPNISDKKLLNLNEEGLIHIGTRVKENDILVGKVTPLGQIQLAPEERLLYAIFGEKIANVKNSSLKVPIGLEGIVIDVQVYVKENIKKLKEKLTLSKITVNQAIEKITDEFILLKNKILFKIEKLLLNKINIFIIKKKLFNNKLQKLKLNDIDKKNKLINLISEYKLLKKEFNKNLKIIIKKISNTTELPSGVLKLVKVFIASKRQLQAGDKMSGRHGNKGVVSKICRREDMPYDEYGIPVDIVLNPLGVPSRMNVGQILETHLGLAAKGIGKVINNLLKNYKTVLQIRNLLNNIYNIDNNLQQKIDFDTFTDEEIIILAKNLCNGLPIATPVFDGATEYEIKNLLKLAKQPYAGKIILFDGCNGERIKQKVTVGYMYMLKLNHLVDDKMHARSNGAYSLITQQPLGGKSQFGGQRFGEMEVWALEAYGAAYTLQEILTVKSDDIIGRSNIFHNIINENYTMKPGIPESFNVLIKEIRSLGLNIELILSNKKNNL